MTFIGQNLVWYGRLLLHWQNDTEDFGHSRRSNDVWACVGIQNECYSDSPKECITCTMCNMYYMDARGYNLQTLGMTVKAYSL